jgi:hypothetical protein
VWGTTRIPRRSPALKTNRTPGYHTGSHDWSAPDTRVPRTADIWGLFLWIKTGRDGVGLETGNCGNVTVSSPPDEGPFVEYITTNNLITQTLYGPTETAEPDTTLSIPLFKMPG